MKKERGDFDVYLTVKDKLILSIAFLLFVMAAINLFHSTYPDDHRFFMKQQKHQRQAQ